MLENRDVDGALQFDEMDRLRSGASLEDQTMLNSSNLPRYNIPGITVPRVEDAKRYGGSTNQENTNNKNK